MIFKVRIPRAYVGENVAYIKIYGTHFPYIVLKDISRHLEHT
jgi:hypothetical protein